MKDNERNETYEGNEILKQQLLFYKSKDLKVHIKKINGQFYNGFVLEVAGDMLILDDRKLGAMPISFVEIDILEKYMEEGI